MSEDFAALQQQLAEVIQRLDKAEKRISAAEDIEQIKQLTLRYITGHTMNDGELEAEGFADDAVFEIGQRPMAGKRLSRNLP